MDAENPTGVGQRAASVSARGWGWRHATRLAPTISGLDLEISPGERVLLLGESGAGKSTLLAALCGVLGGPDDGEEAGKLLLDGASPRNQRGRVGLVLQDPDSQTILSRLGDDVAFGCENLAIPAPEIWSRVASSLRSVGLGLPISHPTQQLSGGQRQRLVLAGVLAMRPGLLLLDEPTANLDEDGVSEVRSAVAATLAATGATLIVVEHRVDIWLDLVSRVIVLESGGGVAFDDHPDRVFRDHGQALKEMGIWLPGFVPPDLRVRASGSTGPAGPAGTPAAFGPGSSATPNANRSKAKAAGNFDASGSSALLSTEGLAIGRSKNNAVQNGIDLSLNAGELTAITGRNGSGKTTLALTLAGLIPAIAGTVDASAIAAGLSGEPIKWRSRELITRIGMVFQEPGHQFVARSVLDELLLGFKHRGSDRRAARDLVDELASRLRLDHLLNANPFTLSGGEQRRLSVATVLATAPRVIVLDEPTFGQDARTWLELATLIAQLRNDGRAVVAVSHDPWFVSALADRRMELS